MASLLRKTDTLFGHLIEETASGVVYCDDRSAVDFANPRPCFGCKLRAASGQHDPCIANLAGTKNACCGHGIELSPGGNLAGYVALDNGRSFRFAGTVGGERIRAAVEAALRNDDLPDGFFMDEQKMWWTGLSESQRDYVHQQTPPSIAAIVQEVTGKPVCDGFLQGSLPWWEGVSEEHKAEIWARFPAMVEALADAARQLPADTAAATTES